MRSRLLRRLSRWLFLGQRRYTGICQMLPRHTSCVPPRKMTLVARKTEEPIRSSAARFFHSSASYAGSQSSKKERLRIRRPPYPQNAKTHSRPSLPTVFVGYTFGGCDRCDQTVHQRRRSLSSKTGPTTLKETATRGSSYQRLASSLAEAGEYEILLRRH